MKLEDKRAHEALDLLLEQLRREGRKSCIIEAVVCEGNIVEVRPVKREKGISLKAS